MADRSFRWGSGRSPMRRATELGGRRRHDQQRLLVELELDDSLYQDAVRSGMEHKAPWNLDGSSGKRSSYAEDTSRSRYTQLSYGQATFVAEPKPRLLTRSQRDSTTKPLSERQMQQYRAKRLSSPYKLKQEVLGTRNSSTSQRYRQQSSHNTGGSSTQRVVRSPTLQQSPAQLVIESVRQNIHLRDQVMAHLQQELMGVLPLHRAHHGEKNISQRVVKLLNRMRSLSLAVVEAVVYLSSELGEVKLFSTGVEHDILEQDFYRYLLQMASDTDFLAYSPPLQRFFENFEVNLTRNPFVDGLSLDSSEVLLCSCHQRASSGALFCSASLSSSSLLRLLKQKLETFALQTQRYLPSWQILPAERVAAALLHLVDLETRFNAIRMLPKYLQSHNDNEKFLHSQRGRDDGYGTFEDDEERIQRLDLHNSLSSRAGKHDLLEAWAGSPTAKSHVPPESRPFSSRTLTPSIPYQPLTSSKLSPEAVQSVSRKEEDARTPSLPSSAWIQLPSPASVRTNSSLEHSSLSTPVSTTSSKLCAGNQGDANVRSPSVLDVAAIAKVSTRSSSSDKSGSQRIAENKPVKDEVQINQRSTPPSARTISARSMGNEAIQMCDEKSIGTEVMIRPSIEILTIKDRPPPTNEVDVTIGSSAAVSNMDVTEPPEMHELIDSSSYEYRMPRNTMDPLPPSLGVEHFVLSGDRKSDESIETQSSRDQCGACIDSNVGVHGEAESEDDDEYECDFGYSSNEALSSIAMALQKLPNFSLSNVESSLTNEIFKAKETIAPIDFESLELAPLSRTGEHGTGLSVSDTVSITISSLSIPGMSSAPMLASIQYETGVLMESAHQSAEMPPPEDDEYAYSSTTALSSIAMALSLLPNVSRDNVFSVPTDEPEQEFETRAEVCSPRSNTYRPVEYELSQREEPRQMMDLTQVSTGVLSERSLARANFSRETSNDALYSEPVSSRTYDQTLTIGRTDNPSAVSPHSNTSTMVLSRSGIPAAINDEVVRSMPLSSRSSISEATSYQKDDDCQLSEFNRIFTLCRDIQVAAFDMSHWVSQREVEDHIQSVAQPFSSLMGYASPEAMSANDNAPKYLERELKMLRRNFTSWKVAIVDQKRAKLVVRRLVARRKIRHFVLYHHCRQLQARIEEANRLRFLAASRIQRNWSLYCHNKNVAKRKATFRVVHMAFHRTIFFVGISRRRSYREYAKDKLVRWWRFQRFRIKKNKQRQEKLVREREQRSRARRDIQTFLKEILLRRRLKTAEEMAKSILFKEQLKWTKAKRDVERTMKINSKHRRELIEDMNARLVDLDHRWKVAEEERLQLLTHHERVVHQQQQAVEVRRKRLAALKIQMFFRVCHFHRKLRRVETEKKQYEIKLQQELVTKEKLEVETQKHISKTRTQVRVLERKIGRMAQEALQTVGRHREIVQVHQQREVHSQERAAQLKIKAFIDTRTLCRRADRERRRLLLEQARLLTEKTETELMSSEEQREHRRTASLAEADLKQRLSELEARSEALVKAKNQLAVEKAQEAQRAAETLEHNKLKASMQQIASWVFGQMQLSKIKKENAAISTSAAREMIEERQKQRREIDAKMREVASIKASSFMRQRISQHRNHKTVEAIRIQHHQRSAREKVIATCTRTQLVQIIIDIKLLTERETNKGIAEGLSSVAQFYRAHIHKCAKVKYLRSVNCARKIQQASRQWIHQQRIKRAEELAFSQLREVKRRQALARRIQIWWRKQIQIQQKKREQQLAFDARIESIRVRAFVRRIQGAWQHWTKHEHERRRAQQLAFEEHVNAIRLRANVRKIQGVWKKWVLSERERRHQQQLAFDKHLKIIKNRASTRKIQRVWRGWVHHEQERRIQQQRMFDAHLELIRVRANVRRIQGVWRRWVQHEQNRRYHQQLVFDESLLAIRVRANVRKIQRAWRRWAQHEQVRRHVRQLAFDAQLNVIRIQAYVRKIQGVWRRWIKSEHDRRCLQQLAFDTRLEAIRIQTNARKIQCAWRQWVACDREQKERRHVHRLVFLSTHRIQRWWRKWQQKKRVTATRDRIMRNACAQVIQRKWKRWHRSQLARRERLQIQRVEQDKAQKGRTLQISTTRIQRACYKWWKQKQSEKFEIDAVKRIQRAWRRWCKRSCEKAEQERHEHEERSVALRIQQNWAGKLFRRNKQQDERKRCLGAQRIQRKWRRWHRHEKAVQSKKRLEEDQCISATLLQRAWKRWHLAHLEHERQAQLEQRSTAAALIIQQLWQKNGKLEVKRYQLQQQYACAYKIQKLWRSNQATLRVLKKEEFQRQETEPKSQNEDEQLQQEYGVNALKIQTFWRKELKYREKQREMVRVKQTRNTSSLTIQRNWGIRQHRRKMERTRIQHEQHMAALKIQMMYLKWHHEQQEEIERERIRQEQDESSMKIQQNWGMSHQRRKLSQERIRHKQNFSALKIQKHWRRWRHLRHEQQTNSNDLKPQKRRNNLKTERKPDTIPLGHDEKERQERLDAITHRSYGRCIARAVMRYLQNRRESSAATKIEAIWRGKLYRTYYLQAQEEKHAEESRQYRLMISVLATKVQVCWRRWNIGVRQVKRAAVKSEELRLIEETKVLERRLLTAKRELAAKRIQRALASRRALIATKGISHREAIQKGIVAEQETPTNRLDEEPLDHPQNEETTCDLQESAEVPVDQFGIVQEPIELSKQGLIHATVELTVKDWSDRQLPHILSRSVNQILFCHEAVTVLQKCFRDYQTRQKIHFYFQRLFAVTPGEQAEADKSVSNEYFHFYFVKARAWLDWDVSKSTRSASWAPDTNRTKSLLRLRFDSQMTRKLLQLIEPSDEYLSSEIEQVLHEITTDAFPILLSSICLEDNDNPRPELRYHDVGELELPLSVKLLRQMEQHRAQLRRQQLLKINTSSEELIVSPTSSVTKSVSSSPNGRSASSSPSQRAKKEVTIFSAVENASVDDAIFLLQRGADLGILESKTQRNALHMLSFSKENFRSRVEMLEFLLIANLNVDGVDCNGDAPLMLYASLGHLEFIQKLLEHGADIQLTNHRGQNVLHRACEEDQVEICGFLQQLMMKDSIEKNTMLGDTVAKLLPPTLVLHTPDSEGRYPLHCLAEKGFVECAKQLVITTQANHEWNRMLQAQGDSQGRTALHLAVLSHDIAMTTFLLTPGGGSNVNCFDDLHRSPLHYAVESPAALPIISRLIQHGASVNVADERGDTPLHWAAFLGRAAVAQSLLALGADPTLTNSDWETPAQIAAAYGQLDCMRLLVQAQRRHGAAPSIEAKDQQQKPLIRPASEKTALQRLEEAVHELHQKQASYHVAATDRDTKSTIDADQAHGGYWEELHQDVQLVEESGQFSSEDEDELLFGHDDDNDINF